MSRLARAIIELVVDRSRAKAEIEAAKADIQSIKKDAEAASSPSGSGAESIAAERLGALAAAAAAVGPSIAAFIDSVANIDEDVGNRIEAITAPIEKLRRQIGSSPRFDIDVGEAERKIRTLRERVNETVRSVRLAGEQEIQNSSYLTKVLNDKTLLGKFARDDFDKLRRSIDQADRGAVAAQRRQEKEIRDEVAAGQKKAAEDRAAADKKAAEDLVIQQLDGVDLVAAEQKRAIKELADRRSKAETDVERDAIDERIDATNRLFDARKRKIQEEKRQDEERERKRKDDDAQRQGEIIAKAFAREVDIAAKKLSDAIRDATRDQQSASQSALNQIAVTVSSLQQVVNARLKATGANVPGGGRYGG